MATNSIVDFLNAQGKDSSFAARKELARQQGNVDYSGSSSDNLSLLSFLQPKTASTSPKPVSTVTPVVSSNPAVQQVSNMTKIANTGATQISTAAQLAEQKRIADAAALATKQKIVTPPVTPLTPEQQVANQGMQTIYDRATGESKQIPDTEVIPPTFTKIDVRNPIAQDTVSSSDSQFVVKKLADGTYGKYDQSGAFLGMTDQTQYDRMKVGSAAEKAYQDALTNGPLLNDNQKAIIKGISDTYQRLLNTQATMNANATNSTAVFQNMYGFAGTDMSNKAIQGEAEKGAAKIADINSRMTSDIAKMTESLKSDNLAQLKDAYNSYVSNSASLQNEIDTQKQRAQAMADKAQQQKETADNAITNDINTFQAEVAKAGGAEDPVAYATALANNDYSGMVKAAGNILTGGIGGEYNIYKKDMITRGLKPLSFDAYQTADANRKAKIAAAGATRMGGQTGLTKDELKVINGVNSVITASPVYKTVQSAKAFVDGVKASLAEGTGLGDISAINQFQKVIDEGAVTRDQDVKLVIGAQTVMDRLNTWKKRNVDTGEVMSPELRNQMNSVMASLLKVKEQRLLSSPEIASQLRIASKTGILPEDTIIGAIQSPDVTVGEEHKQEAINKKTSLLEWSKADPKNTNVMNSLRSAFPNASPEEIYDKLKAKSYIK